MSTNLISQHDALEVMGHENVSFVDASWYLPAQNRNALAEYRSMRIPNAVFFDIDAIADQSSDLPHMLPQPEVFAKNVSVMGISHDNLIIVYDGPGLFSAPRVWWTFKVMGALDVRILEGGFDRWKAADLPVETGNPNPQMAKVFQPSFKPELVASLEDMERNVVSCDATVIDARSGERFAGRAEEPRPGLRSGHIPGSKSLPFNKLIEDGKLVSNDRLEGIFKKLGIDESSPVITTCGSGVTAAILSLALSETGRENYKLFDGSWAQWGLPDGPEIATEDG